LIARLIYCVPQVVELRDFPSTFSFHHKVMQVGDQVRVVPSF
jgi:hypothetical protein